MAVKLTAGEVQGRLAPVKNRDGAEVEAQSDFIVPVDFFVDSRGVTYQALVQTNLYSLGQVLDFQAALGRMTETADRNRARKSADEAIAAGRKLLEEDPDGPDSHRARSLLVKIQEVAGALPEYVENYDASRKQFDLMTGFLEIGLICWNVPDIEPTKSGMMEGEFQVVSAAVEALREVILPSSEAAKTQEAPSADASSSTTMPSSETSDDLTNDTSAASSQSNGIAPQTAP